MEKVEPNAAYYIWDFGNRTKSSEKTIIFRSDKVENRTICAFVSNSKLVLQEKML